jgi:hypothetical protein
MFLVSGTLDAGASSPLALVGGEGASPTERKRMTGKASRGK